MRNVHDALKQARGLLWLALTGEIVPAEDLRAALTAADAALAEEGAQATTLARINQWAHEYGAALKSRRVDSYGEGMRDAKEQVQSIIATSRAQPPPAPVLGRCETPRHTHPHVRGADEDHDCVNWKPAPAAPECDYVGTCYYTSHGRDGCLRWKCPLYGGEGDRGSAQPPPPQGACDQWCLGRCSNPTEVHHRDDRSHGAACVGWRCDGTGPAHAKKEE